MTAPPSTTTRLRKGPPYLLEDPVGRVRGIGPSWAEELAEKGIRTIADLLACLPHRFADRRFPRALAEAELGVPLTAIGLVSGLRRIRTRRRGMEMMTVLLNDGTAEMPVIFFNRSYLADLLTPGRRLLVQGVPRWGRGGLELHNPEFDLLEPEADPSTVTGWVPVYGKLGPLSPRRMRAVTTELLAGLAPLTPLLPASVTRHRKFPDRRAAFDQVHRPPLETPPDDLERRRTPGHRLLAFEEFFFLELGLAVLRRRRAQEQRLRCYAISEEQLERLQALLPFQLTGAQRRVLAEIVADLRQPHPMNRLLLGDVGSGKTVLALLGMLLALESGHQAALMAPTEILAQQHAANLQRILLQAGIKVELLTAGIPAGQQRDVRSRLASGQAKIVVGTHSLISDKVAFNRLGLVVIDEQHRFGVVQRADLMAKGERPDVLVMSATPIPRTLAMVMYGDLEVSILDEKPPGRQPIKTVVRTTAERERVLAGLHRALAENRQAFVVRPAVEETNGGRRTAEDGLKEYRALFPEAGVVMVHGKLGSNERQANLEAFAAGRCRLLVATTVIEVGIDVPAASVMVVEDADRFGLAQLHQLRGRVGRGDQRSYCVLVASENAAPEALDRLKVLERLEDGFRIAETDLELRGPGEFAGTAQSGFPDFQVADIVRHRDLLLAAREEAFRLIETTGEAGIPPVVWAETLRRYGARLRLAKIG